MEEGAFLSTAKVGVFRRSGGGRSAVDLVESAEGADGGGVVAEGLAVPEGSVRFGELAHDRGGDGGA